MPTPVTYLGIELNPHALQLVVQDDRGEAIADIRRQLSDSDGPEQDPKDWWRLLRTTTKDLLRRSKIDPVTIRGVGITATTEGAVILDEQAESICPVILGAHPLLDASATAVRERFGPRNLRNLTGRRASTSSVITKLAWIAEHHRRAWHDCRTILQPADYLRLRLTDEIATDASTASRSVLLNPRARDWSPRVLETMGIESDWLPVVSHGLQIIGRITPTAARECGLHAGTPVAAAGNPACAAALAVGGVAKGDLIAELGGSGTALAVSDDVHRDPSGRSDLACHCLDRTWINECGAVAAVGPLDWLRDHVLREELVQAKRAKRSPIAHISELAATTETGADGLLVLDGDHQAHHLLNLNRHHQRPHLARAVLEAAACAINHCRERVAGLGIEPRRILLHGPGTESDLWCQMVADATGRSVTRNTMTDLPARGAAVMACVACTKRSLKASGAGITRHSDTLKPRAAARKAYQELAQRYRDAQSKLDNDQPAATITGQR